MSTIPLQASSRSLEPSRLRAKADGGGVVVIGANYRALGVVRSLGRRGIKVCVLKETDERLAGASRYAGRNFKWPSGDDSEKIAFLLDLATKHDVKGWLLVPTDDEGARLIAQNHEVLDEHFGLTTPAWNVLRWAYDKRLTYALSKKVGVDSPWTACPASREELAEIECPFPAIIKPAYKPRLNPLTAAKAWPVTDRHTLLDAYDKACKLVDPAMLMIQELVPGSGECQLSYVALVKDGQPLASLVARRIRQIPIDFGRFSTYVETTDEPAIIEPACRLLREIHFTGLVEVEFKWDERDRLFKLLDINPRIWGWHTLGASVGIDFSYLLWLMVRGQEIPTVCGRPGVGWIRFSADLAVAIGEILKGRLGLEAYARSLRHAREEAIFASDDPLPALLDLPHVLYKLGRRRLRG
jgi:D-aspartate ligase